MNQLNGKKVLVVGGSSGMGKAIALATSKMGAELIITGRTPEHLEQVKKEGENNGIKIQTHCFDAHDRKALDAFFSQLSPVDHVVSMIGDVMGGGFLTSDEAVIRHVVESKFFTNLAICRLAAPLINKGGSITITSGSGRHPHEASASFIGNQSIKVMVEGLAMELAPNVRVNTVAPFWMDTPFWRNMERKAVEENKTNLSAVIPMGRTANIEEVVEAYLFLILNSFVTGQLIAVDGGIMLA